MNLVRVVPRQREPNLASLAAQAVKDAGDFSTSQRMPECGIGRTLKLQVHRQIHEPAWRVFSTH